MEIETLEKAIALKKEYLKYKSEVEEIDDNINALKKSGAQSGKLDLTVSYFKNSDSSSSNKKQINCFISRSLIIKQLNNDRYKASNLMNKYKLEIEKL